MKPNPLGMSVALWALLLSPLFMASTCAPRELEPGGAYMGDTLLARFDATLLEVEAVFDDVIGLADRNPEAIASNNDLAEAVAKIRAELDGVPGDNETLTRLIRARNAYVSAKSAVTGRALEGELTGARVALQTARDLLPLFVSPSTD